MLVAGIIHFHIKHITKYSILQKIYIFCVQKRETQTSFEQRLVRDGRILRVNYPL